MKLKMREFKFRAWNKDLNEPRMEYFNLFDISRTFDGGMGHEYSIDDKDRVGVYGSIIRIEDIMQYTGLKDKNDTCKEVYEDDIIDKNGKVIGNKYETPALLKDSTNLLVQGFGTETWETTNREAMGRGCFYTERHASTDEVRELE